MLAYRASFCCCRSKVCSDAFINLFFTEFLTTWVHVEMVSRQFEFTQVKVVKLGVEHYDYNMSCGNNNVQHNYSDHACLPSTSSRVLTI